MRETLHSGSRAGEAAVKLSLDPSVAAPRSSTPESLALATWYDSHPAIRRMWAIRHGQTLRVVVALEPTLDDSDVHPAWLANGRLWARELHSHIGGSVELELVDELRIDGVETDAKGDVVVAMCWRDPAFLFV